MMGEDSSGCTVAIVNGTCAHLRYGQLACGEGNSCLRLDSGIFQRLRQENFSVSRGDFLPFLLAVFGPKSLVFGHKNPYFGGNSLLFKKPFLMMRYKACVFAHIQIFIWNCVLFRQDAGILHFPASFSRSGIELICTV
jgi:hypothetical protein